MVASVQFNPHQRKSSTIKLLTKSNTYIIFRFLAEFTSRASSLITFPLMARYLGTEGYGVNTQTSVIISFLIPVATLGLGFGVVRIMAGNQTIRNVSARLYSTLITVIIASAFLSFLMFLSAPFLNKLFIKVDWATEIIRWSAPLILFTAVEMAIKDYYRARLRIISYSVMQSLQTVCYVSAVALVLTSGGGLLQVVWAWLGIKLGFNLICLFYLMIIKEIEPFPSFMPLQELLDILRFGFPIVVAGLGTWITSVGDRWVIGFFMNIRDVAIYNAAYTLAGVISAIASPFWNPLYPEMASSYNNNDMPALHRACRKYTNGFALIGIPSVAGLILLANPLLIKLGSSDFSIDTVTFALLILGLFSDQISANAHYLVYLHNEPKYMRNVSIISGLTNLVLNLTTIPFLGITGAALATFFSYLLLDFLLFRRVLSYGINITDVYDLTSLIKYAGASLVMVVVVSSFMYFYEMTFIMTLMMAGLGGFVYLLSLFIIHGFKIRNIFQNV
ncbi:MAG: oligosaccharide flippase family protein [Anaerolineaceae bacterium]